MSFATIAIVNGILAIGIVSALAYVCRLPFRLESALAESAWSLPLLPNPGAGWFESWPTLGRTFTSAGVERET